MMNTPSMYSVDQLLKARQNGVPDYVVVPMLQKAMAQKQAMAQQQALQQGAPKPPVAQQILDAAHNDVMQEHMARQVEEAPEPRGIDSLPSGIDESDYAGGGIIAFAEGGDTPYQVDEADYAPAYTGADLDPNAQRDRYLSSIGTNPAIAKQEERISAREASLKGEEDKAPWMALMQAGLATMSGTSPNAFANIGEGASKGLSAYGESKKAIAGRMDKLDELRGRMEEAQRTEAVAAANFGFNSVEHKQAANEKRALEKQAAKLAAGLGANKFATDKEQNDITREGHRLSAGNAAASLAETKRYHDLLSGGKGGKETLNQEINNIEDDIKYLALQDKTMQEDINKSDDEKAQHSAWVRGKQTELLNKKRQLMKLDPLGEFTYTAPPVDDGHFWEKWSDTTPQPKKTAVGNPKIDALVSKYSQ
jgi:hypothetical protein